jgi:tetratricopeptide (TPR) repeat protein
VAARTADGETLMQLWRERANLLAVADREITNDRHDAATITGALRVIVPLHLLGYLQKWVVLLELGPRIERLLELAADSEPLDPSVEVEALSALGQMALRTGIYDRADAILDQALRLATDSGNGIARGRISGLRGVVRVFQGNLSDAERYYERAVAVAHEQGDRLGEAWGLMRLGELTREHGQAREAIAHLEHALVLFDALGSRVPEAWCLAILAVTHSHLGESDRARATVDRAMALANTAGDRYLKAYLFTALANVHHEAKEFDAAVALRETMMEQSRQMGDRRFEALCRGYIGLALFQQGKLEDALTCVRRCHDVSRDVGDSLNALEFAAFEAAMCAVQGHIEEAEARFARAEQELDPSSGDLPGIVLSVLRGAVDVARALRARAEGAPWWRVHLERACERARAARASTDPHVLAPASRALDVRLALQLVDDAISRATANGAGSEGEPDVLHLHVGGRWFALGSGPRVDCGGHEAPRRILLALARRWLHAPDEPLPASELVKAAWPGERIQPAAARNRLHVALTTLRKLGLRDVLTSRDEGYVLAPSVAVRTVYDPKARPRQR